MELLIILSNRISEEKFYNLIHCCLHDGIDSNGSEILNWTTANFNNLKGEKETGFKHINTQFEKNGWITIERLPHGIKAVFRRSKKIDTASEQEAIILFRFATMLRNHFSRYISSITISGL